MSEGRRPEARSPIDASSGQYGQAYIDIIAPGMWSFTDAGFPVLGTGIPKVHIAMWNVATREVFQGDWPPLAARGIRHFMRRSIHSAQLYEIAGHSLEHYFQDFRIGRPKFEHYFAALHSIEMCILQAHIAVDSIKNVLPKPNADEIVKDTKTLNILATNIKHFGGQSKSSKGSHKGPHNETFPIFFENGGVTNGKDRLSFVDLRDFISESIRLVDEVINGKRDKLQNSQ